MSDEIIDSILDHVFSPGFTFPGLTYRQEQRIFALDICREIAEPWKHDSPNATLAIGEAAPGIGKTLVILLTAYALAYASRPMEPRRRTVISTYSVALRQQIYDERTRAYEILQTACRDLGFRAPEPIIVAELFSLTQFISPYRVDKFNIHVSQNKNRFTRDEIADWNEFHEFFIVKSSQLEDRPQPVRIEEWIEASGGKPMPLGLGKLEYAVTDRPEDAEIRDLLVAQRDVTKQADVVIATHAMANILTTRLRLNDARERNDRKIVDDQGSFELLINDECHKLPAVARNTVESQIDLKSMQDIVADLKTCLRASSDATSALEELQIWLHDQLQARDIVAINTPAIFRELESKIRPLRDALSSVLIIEDLWDQEPILMFRALTMLVTLTQIIDLHDQSGSADQIVYGMTDAYPIIMRHRNDIILRLSAENGRYSIRSLWYRSERVIPKRMYKTVICVSGTLVDRYPVVDDCYKTFRHEIGAQYLGGARKDVRMLGWSRPFAASPIPAANTGYATSLIYMERRLKLLPSLNQSDATGDYANPYHIDAVANILAHYVANHNTDINRSLVLFVSETTMLKTYRALCKVSPEVASHVILQRKGFLFNGLPLTQFLADPHAMLFTLNWEGINPVDAANRSIVDNLVMTKLPFPPADERRLLDGRFNEAFNWMFTEAVWKMRQGAARAARDPQARFVWWLLDPRMPLPIEMDPAISGLPRVVTERSGKMQQVYEQFDQVVSQRLFGLRSSLISVKPVQIGYLEQQTDGSFSKSLHDVYLEPRFEDKLLAKHGL